MKNPESATRPSSLDARHLCVDLGLGGERGQPHPADRLHHPHPGARHGAATRCCAARTRRGALPVPEVCYVARQRRAANAASPRPNKAKRARWKLRGMAAGPAFEYGHVIRPQVLHPRGVKRPSRRLCSWIVLIPKNTHSCRCRQGGVSPSAQAVQPVGLLCAGY